MIGWAVATGGVSVESLLMFGLIFLWTPPHFWALALFRNDDYTRAGVPMLPVTAGDRATQDHILSYALVLAVAAIAPAFTSVGGPIYLAGALILNALFVAGALRIWRRDAAASAADGFRVEKRFFGFSIVYLFLHFLLLLGGAGYQGRAGDGRLAGAGLRRAEAMRPDSHEIYGRRRSRNLGLALVLGALVLLTFAVTIVKLAEGQQMEGYDHQLRPSLLATEEK